MCGATDRAASRLEAAVTAATMTSEFLTASAAELASRAPIRCPADFSAAPSACGNRMSQAATLSTPTSRSPEAIACPASPKPMKQRRGLLVGLLLVIALSKLALNALVEALDIDHDAGVRAVADPLL